MRRVVKMGEMPYPVEGSVVESLARVETTNAPEERVEAIGWAVMRKGPKRNCWKFRHIPERFGNRRKQEGWRG